jgi:TfoX/Sxy family transcriptional regulator of competence genes
MAYSETLANRIRERFGELSSVKEKEMMGGLVFMYKGKMCVGIIKDELMCRIDPDMQEELAEKTGCRVMTMAKRPMKSYVLIDDTGMKTKKQFDYWIDLALAFNKKAKASKKKKKA